jgi:beta-N-acetylhexosaminidase
MSRACILGCEGPALSGEERAFFRDVEPWGFILFARNVDTPDQVRALTESLREAVDREDAPILIDQEGGRVQRLRPPHWPSYPPGRAYGELAANDPLTRREAARLGARLMAHDLHALGINVDCVPVLDVPAPDGHDVIGDRAYAPSAEEVAVLGRAAAEGLLAGGVLPVVKHIPGHGRARADSHQELPVVDTPEAELDATDFAPFRVLSDMPMAMTAHVVYAAIDEKRPATLSRKVVRRVMREAIGFEGLLMTDDLGMKALEGELRDLARRSLDAGCDVVLHCSGRLSENREVAHAAPELDGKPRRRAKAALNRLVRAPEPLDEAEARARFDELMSGRRGGAPPREGGDPTGDGLRA